MAEFRRGPDCFHQIDCIQLEAEACAGGDDDDVAELLETFET